jgi:hypothetical protein
MCGKIKDFSDEKGEADTVSLIEDLLKNARTNCRTYSLFTDSTKCLQGFFHRTPGF